MLKKLKKNKKKGFTLVELIVVLVILAILAALLIPALTGYIDRAKRKSIVSETRQAVMAAQTISDEDYAKDKAKDATAKTTLTETEIAEVTTLSEVKGTIKSVTLEDGKVAKLIYEHDKKTCTYDKDKTDGTDGNYDVK